MHRKQNEVIIPFCKINCYGDYSLYINVLNALEFTQGGRTGKTSITYDPLLYAMECENVYEWLIDDIREKYHPKIEISNRRFDE